MGRGRFKKQQRQQPVNRGVADAAKCQQMMVELIAHDQFDALQMMANKTLERFSEADGKVKDGGLTGAFMDGFMLGGALIMELFLTYPEQQLKIRNQLMRMI